MQRYPFKGKQGLYWKMTKMILALESSCDDSSVALLDGTELKGMKQRGQTVHEAYGGVVPELASRAHQEVMAGMVLALLEETGTDWSAVEAIAYTRGPGLLGSLMVGASLAKGLAGSLGLPLWGVHHLHGHLVSPFVDQEPDGAFPMLSLTVSGGHTHLVWMESLLQWEVLAETRDDAAGEAFDKCAKMLGLAYPGGPLLDSLSEGGDPHAHTWPFARVGLDSYSFSGLKTSVLYYLQKHPISTDSLAGDPRLADLCASVRYHIVESLLRPLRHWRDALKPRSLALVGGVAANSLLRQRMLEMGGQYGLKVWIPPTRYCTDNAAMIAASARVLMDAGWHQPLALHERPLARWPLQEYLVETGGLNQAPFPGS